MYWKRIGGGGFALLLFALLPFVGGVDYLGRAAQAILVVREAAPNAVPDVTARGEAEVPVEAPGGVQPVPQQSEEPAPAPAAATVDEAGAAVGSFSASRSLRRTAWEVYSSLPSPAPAARPKRPVATPPIPVQVPILMYHYVRVNPDPADSIGFNLSVPPNDLEAQLAFLARNGYQVISLEDLGAYLVGEGAAPPKGAVVLTFDDGYRDFYEAAFPLLKQRGFTATVFMISAFIGRPGYLTAAQLRELAAAGMTIGAHSIDHPDLRRASASEASRQIGGSKAALEKEIGAPVTVFSYPSGSYDIGTVDIVKMAGYRAAVTVSYGLVHAPQERLALSRVRVTGGQTAATMAKNAGLTGQ